MTLFVRQLGPGDEAILIRLETHDADFNLAGQAATLRQLDPAAAQRYLANPAVLYWVAIEDDVLVGSLLCILLPVDAHGKFELLLYDIGVHHFWRRRGIGRTLLAEMEHWMRTYGVNDVWVLADNPAVDFYRSCGFVTKDSQPAYMTRSLIILDI